MVQINRIGQQDVGPLQLLQQQRVPEAAQLNSHQLAVIACAEQAQWEPLLRATVRRSWPSSLIDAAVAVLRDERTPEVHREALLLGDDDPHLVASDGSLVLHPAVLIQRLTTDIMILGRSLGVSFTTLESDNDQHPTLVEEFRHLAQEEETLEIQWLDGLVGDLASHVHEWHRLHGKVEALKGRVDAVGVAPRDTPW